MPRSSALARKLTDGVYGRLEFDFACNRGHAFGEAHLHGVLMEVLASNLDPKTRNIKPSHPLAVIQKAEPKPGEPKRRGRKREVDFAVLERVSASEVAPVLHCIEAKWAGSSHATPANVLVDLTRLALISQEHPEAKCVFLLAGAKDDVERLLIKQLPKLSVESHNSPLDRTYSGKLHRFNLSDAPGIEQDVRLTQRTALVKKFQRLPIQLRTTMYRSGHATPPSWSAIAWRVQAKHEKDGSAARTGDSFG